MSSRYVLKNPHRFYAHTTLSCIRDLSTCRFDRFWSPVTNHSWVLRNNCTPKYTLAEVQASCYNMEEKWLGCQNHTGSKRPQSLWKDLCPGGLWVSHHSLRSFLSAGHGSHAARATTALWLLEAIFSTHGMYFQIILHKRFSLLLLKLL